jgi:hypothetical protein
VEVGDLGRRREERQGMVGWHLEWQGLDRFRLHRRVLGLPDLGYGDLEFPHLVGTVLGRRDVVGTVVDGRILDRALVDRGYVVRPILDGA